MPSSLKGLGASETDLAVRRFDDKRLVLTAAVRKTHDMDRPRLPPLNAIKAFEAAARLGSFVAAEQQCHQPLPLSAIG
jgi:hypothetical protein